MKRSNHDYVLILLSVACTLMLSAASYGRNHVEDVEKFKREATQVFKRCQMLRDSSSLTFRFEQNSKIVSEGNFSSINSKYDKEYTFLRDEWVAKSTKILAPRSYVSYDVRNAIFDFELTPKNEKEFALLKARRITSGKSVYADARARDEIWLIEAASSVSPMRSLVDLLENSSCKVENFSASGDQGFELAVYDPTGVCLNFPESRAKISVDNAFRVERSEIRFPRNGNTYVYVFSVEYPNSSAEGPYLPSRVEFTRAIEGSAGLDQFLARDFKYKRIEFDKEVLTSEHYGIPRSALEAMAPLPPMEKGFSRSWIWLAVAVGFLLSAWVFFKRRA